MLNFSISSEGDVAIVYIVGELDASGADDFSKTMLDIAHDGTAYIILNMTEVSYISSNCIKPLLAWLEETKSASGKRQLALCNLQEFVREVFRITEFDRKFPIYDTEDSALNAFRRRV